MEKLGILKHSYRTFGKRPIDLAVALTALILLFPFLALVALAVRLESPGPALFVQERLGLAGRIFSVYKFRSMTDRLRTSHKQVVGKGDGVTRIGYWLRRFKIDELPQLFNVLKGDMSVVGPRPALPEQLGEYNEVGRRRLLVRPGLTGLAQVHGNIHLSWAERWKYDARYVERHSFLLDAWIILQTVTLIVVGEERFLRRRSLEH